MVTNAFYFLFCRIYGNDDWRLIQILELKNIEFLIKIDFIELNFLYKFSSNKKYPSKTITDGLNMGWAQQQMYGQRQVKM